MKKKVIKLFLILLFIFCFFSVKNLRALETSQYCTKEAALQLAMIARVEAGGEPLENDPSEYMFTRLTTSSIVLNNAIHSGKGDTLAEKISSLSDGMYDTHSDYADGKYIDIVQGEFLYYAELVLTGKYNVPKNIYGQASCRCAGIANCPKEADATWQNDCSDFDYASEWAHVVLNGRLDAYFSYFTNEALATEDVFGHKTHTVEEYKNLANSLKLNDYSAYTTDTVCRGLSEKITGDTNSGGSSDGSSGDNNGGSGNNSGSSGDNNGTDNKCYNISIDVNACENPDILRPLYFGKLIVEIVEIFLPIALIIIAMIDFSKSVVAGDAAVQKKNMSLLIKRIISAVLIFAVPWIINFVMVNLGNLTEGVNFTDCLENADKQKIDELEETYNEKIEEYKEENGCN